MNETCLKSQEMRPPKLGITILMAEKRPDFTSSLNNKGDGNVPLERRVCGNWG